MTQEISIFTEAGFATTMKISEAMVKSGILPRGIDNPFKAFAIIQKGREMGVEPMRALTGIYLIEGKTVVSPELKLECFRQRGGKVQWVESTDKVAHVKLTSSDGSEHHETVTIGEMQAAGLGGKDNWRKYPKSMLRARCIAFALRAMGEGDGSYTPDELGAPDDNGLPEYTPPAKQEAAPAEGKAASPSNRNATENGTMRRAPDVSGREGGATDSPVADLDDDWRETMKATSEALGVPMPVTPAKRPGAKDIKPTGGPISPEQNKLVHVLKGQVGGVFSGDGTDPRDKWARTLAVYRREDGTRCAHTNELSKDQATHLIDRMQGYVEKQGARAASEPDLGAAVGDAPMEDLLQKAFTSDDEEREWVHGLWGQSSIKDLDKTEAATCLQLLVCMSQGSDVYDAAVDKARAAGLCR